MGGDRVSWATRGGSGTCTGSGWALCLQRDMRGEVGALHHHAEYEEPWVGLYIVLHFFFT